MISKRATKRRRKKLNRWPNHHYIAMKSLAISIPGYTLIYIKNNNMNIMLYVQFSCTIKEKLSFVCREKESIHELEKKIQKIFTTIDKREGEWSRLQTNVYNRFAFKSFIEQQYLLNNRRHHIRQQLFCSSSSSSSFSSSSFGCISITKFPSSIFVLCSFQFAGECTFHYC